MSGILALIYLVLGYWAVGETIYANKIRIGSEFNMILNQILLGLFLGFILIPIALIKKFFLHG